MDDGEYSACNVISSYVLEDWCIDADEVMNSYLSAGSHFELI